MKAVVPSVPQDAENYQAFVSEFEERFGEEPTSWSAYAYDAVVVSALAIEAADEFTGSALMEVVRDVTRPEGEEATTYEDAHEILANGGSPSDVDYTGVSGPIDLDENGDPVGLLQVFEVVDHAYESSGFIEAKAATTLFHFHQWRRYYSTWQTGSFSVVSSSSGASDSRWSTASPTSRISHTAIR